MSVCVCMIFDASISVVPWLYNSKQNLGLVFPLKTSLENRMKLNSVFPTDVERVEKV